MWTLERLQGGKNGAMLLQTSNGPATPLDGMDRWYG